MLSPVVGSQHLPLQDYQQLANLGLLTDFIRAECLQVAIGAEQLTQQEAEAAFQLYARQRQLGDQAALERYARAQVLGPQALEAEVLGPVRQQKFSQREFGAKAEARFLERKTQLDRVVYSLLRLRDPGLARELYLRIDSGEANFADLAAQYAEGPEQATRGIVGPAPLTQAHPLLVDRLRTATPGVVLEPFEIEEWSLVVRLESLVPASFDEATAARMVQELFEQWLGLQVEQRLELLRNQLLDSP
jgi:parvulin-like peptidyl-prolyl isomerase